jgi:excisionase family DNA binding protein
MAEREGDLMTTQQALALLKISRSTLYKMMEAGELVPERNPMQRKQKRLYFRRADVERLLREGRKRI